MSFLQFATLVLKSGLGMTFRCFLNTSLGRYSFQIPTEGGPTEKPWTHWKNVPQLSYVHLAVPSDEHVIRARNVWKYFFRETSCYCNFFRYRFEKDLFIIILFIIVSVIINDVNNVKLSLKRYFSFLHKE